MFKTNLWKEPTKEDIKLGTKASNYDLIVDRPIKTDVEEVWFAVCSCSECANADTSI